MSQSFDDIQTQNFILTEEHRGQRLDKVLALLCPDLSRTRIQQLIEAGEVMLRMQNQDESQPITSASLKVQGGECVDIEIPAPLPLSLEPENIPLDIVYEDDDLIVLNKQAGLVVHPAAGHWSGTLVNALLYHCGSQLSGINGVIRPGIVHRLDKDTSGLMLVAKNDFAHQSLSEQLQTRELMRVYHALCLGVPVPIKGEVAWKIGRHATHRLKMSINGKSGREALTYYHVLKSLALEKEGLFSLVECRLQTGRTHQIRVHMEALGHPLIGDPLYGPQDNAVAAKLKKTTLDDLAKTEILKFPRQALHAKKIRFVHPRLNEEMDFECDYPIDIIGLIEKIGLFRASL
jgi:23S rRNA pseudouridine1911/1915/1917 synthase